MLTFWPENYTVTYEGRANYKGQQLNSGITIELENQHQAEQYALHLGGRIPLVKGEVFASGRQRKNGWSMGKAGFSFGTLLSRTKTTNVLVDEHVNHAIVTAKDGTESVKSLMVGEPVFDDLSAIVAIQARLFELMQRGQTLPDQIELQLVDTNSAGLVSIQLAADQMVQTALGADPHGVLAQWQRLGSAVAVWYDSRLQFKPVQVQFKSTSKQIEFMLSAVAFA